MAVTQLGASFVKEAQGKPRRPVRQVRRREPLLIAALILAGLGLGVVLGLPLVDGTLHELRVPGGTLLFAGSVTGLVGAYLTLCMVLLAARIPLIERTVGRGGAMMWHRSISVLAITLLAAHALLVTIADARTARVGVGKEFATLLKSYPWMLEATIALGLMLVIGLVSLPLARSRVSRESWWLLHLTIYAALVLALLHELALGPSFVNHPLATAVWIAVWVLAGIAVLSFRIALPALRSLRHDLRVAEVDASDPRTVTVVLQGRKLERLRIRGGQFFEWRFLSQGRWHQAHPFSVSGGPTRGLLRLTIKRVGDFTEQLATLSPGTRVAFEGPYGTLTAEARTRTKALLVAGGMGVTAIRGLLVDLPPDAQPAVVLRVHDRDHIPLLAEIEALASARKGEVYLLAGGRYEIDLAAICDRIPDFADRDVFIAGPPGLLDRLVSLFRQLGVPREALHVEPYAI